jgi:ferritin-like metal-binding protein YciE
VLPKLQQQATAEGLVTALGEHLEETKEHAVRLEQVFRALGAEPSSNLCAPVEKLAEHHDEQAGSIKEERLADCYHAFAAATTEHYELSAYDALLALAPAVELDGDARKLLEQNRGEEERALGKVRAELERLVQALT